VNDPEFTEALKTVLRDLAAQCEVQPQVRTDGEWTMLYAPDGTGHGVGWPATGPAPDRLAILADQVQDWAVEALWSTGAPAVWPHCPQHPNTHPPKATVVEETAVWSCPKSGATVARIGELEIIAGLTAPPGA
jgi:hypothetical protein